MTGDDVQVIQLVLTAVNTMVLPALFAVARAWWAFEKRMLKVEHKLGIESP